MPKNKMCDQKRLVLGGDFRTQQKIPRKRVACPKCKRRILARIVVDGDGDMYYGLPPHKVKAWWRKKNKIS